MSDATPGGVFVKPFNKKIPVKLVKNADAKDLDKAQVKVVTSAEAS